MKHRKEPDPSRGGTFIRDRDGTLIQYIPTTRPHDAPVQREELIERVVETIEQTIDLVEAVAKPEEPNRLTENAARRRRSRTTTQE